MVPSAVRGDLAGEILGFFSGEDFDEDLLLVEEEVDLAVASSDEEGGGVCGLSLLTIMILLIEYERKVGR
jgi:hypothetical protein